MGSNTVDLFCSAGFAAAADIMAAAETLTPNMSEIKEKCSKGGRKPRRRTNRGPGEVAVAAAEAKTAEAKTAEAKTAEAKTAEAKPAEAKPAEAKAAETNAADVDANTARSNVQTATHGPEQILSSGTSEEQRLKRQRRGATAEAEAKAEIHTQSCSK